LIVDSISAPLELENDYYTSLVFLIRDGNVLGLVWLNCKLFHLLKVNESLNMHFIIFRFVEMHFSALFLSLLPSLPLPSLHNIHAFLCSNRLIYYLSNNTQHIF
jgi:hypothetical protein